jgi:hypothetical protein
MLETTHSSILHAARQEGCQSGTSCHTKGNNAVYAVPGGIPLAGEG